MGDYININKIFGLLYSCTALANLHYFFLGVVIYFCTNQKIYKYATIIFLIGAIGSIIIEMHYLSYTFIFASIIILLMTIKNFSLSSRLKRIIDVIDKYSFTLYLVHGVVFYSIIDKLKLFNISKILIVVIAILGTIILTWIVGKNIGKPLQELLCKKLLKEK